jgi:hypothetical protein
VVEIGEIYGVTRQGFVELGSVFLA